MDYMNLGVTSRKTGIKIRQDIRKDEYSMDNVDEFFKDNESSISFRRKSRKSSLLPFDNSAFPPPVFEGRSRRSTNFLPPSVPTIDENYAEPSIEEAIQPELDGSMPNDWGDEGGAEDKELPLLPEKQVDNQPKKSENKTINYEPDYRSDDFENDGDAEGVPQTPPSDYGNESYRDVPDLVADDDDDDDEPSHGNTSFNTSENALLEDELERDNGSLSEEDRDYVEPSGLLDAVNSSESEGEDSEIDYGGAEKRSAFSNVTNNSYNSRQKGAKNAGHSGQEGSLEESSDEEFIQDQAQDLGREVNFARVNGLRKSNRVKIAPLEYWRNEKVVYKRKSRKPVLEIDKVITFEEEDDEEEEDLRRRKKSKNRPYNYTSTGRPRGRPRKGQNTGVTSETALHNPNQHLITRVKQGTLQNSGWYEAGEYRGLVNASSDHKHKEEDILARSNFQSIPQYRRNTKDESYTLAVLFDKNKESFASGILTLPLGADKKLSDSYNVAINFYLIEGVIEITIGQNKLICTEGCAFQVPAFNEYSLSNKGKSIAKMYFVQVSLPELSNTKKPTGAETVNLRQEDSRMGDSLSDMSISQG
ncbi:LAFA_0F08900g1_1 [Lachancea sp. 'fantastica']|nr:LAFA_0F08900g1_1 [Lachancea sp. 'fantastica']